MQPRVMLYCRWLVPGFASNGHALSCIILFVLLTGLFSAQRPSACGPLVSQSDPTTPSADIFQYHQDFMNPSYQLLVSLIEK